MAKLFANSGDLYQMLRSAVSDLGLHCLPITLLGFSRLLTLTVLKFECPFYYLLICPRLPDSVDPDQMPYPLASDLGQYYLLRPGPKVIKLFSCSIQLSTNFSANKYDNPNISWHFHIY